MQRYLLIVLFAMVAPLVGPSQEQLGEPGPKPGKQVQVPTFDCRVVFSDRVTLSAGRAGLLTSILEEGQAVQADQIAIRLDDKLLEAAHDIAEHAAGNQTLIDSGKEALRLAQDELDIVQKANSMQARAYPQVEVARRESAVRAARLQIAQAEHEKRTNELVRDQARAELDTSYVKSPINGFVVKRLMHVGEHVQNGEALLEVVDTSTARIEGNVAVNDSWRVKMGQEIIVVVRYPTPEGVKEPFTTREYDATLGFVDVSAKRVSGFLRVWAVVKNDDGRLREGLEVNMRIKLPESGDGED